MKRKPKFRVGQKGWNAANAAARELMACSHPRACWGDEDSYSPINGVNMKTGEGQPFGHCTWCAELKGLREVIAELLELYPQTYRCEFGLPEMTHFQPEDWKAIRAKLEALLRPQETQVSASRDDKGAGK